MPTVEIIAGVALPHFSFAHSRACFSAVCDDRAAAFRR